MRLSPTPHRTPPIGPNQLKLDRGTSLANRIFPRQNLIDRAIGSANLSGSSNSDVVHGRALFPSSWRISPWMVLRLLKKIYRDQWTTFCSEPLISLPRDLEKKMSRGEARSNLFLAGSGSSFSLLLRDVETGAGRKYGGVYLLLASHAAHLPVLLRQSCTRPPRPYPIAPPPCPSPPRPLPAPVTPYPIDPPPRPLPSPPPPHPRVLSTQADHGDQADPCAFGI